MYGNICVLRTSTINDFLPKNRNLENPYPVKIAKTILNKVTETDTMSPFITNPTKKETLGHAGEVFMFTFPSIDSKRPSNGCK